MHARAWKAIAAAAVLGLGACTDLTTEPKSTVTGANAFNEPGTYRAYIAKLYAGLAVSGQSDPNAGNSRPDIEGIDAGFSQYIRLLWQMQELPTDEAVIAWNDAGVQELNTQLWSSSNQFTVAMYNRIFFQVQLANDFLRETADDRLSQRGVSASLRNEIGQYRAEARYLRALSYWHGIDLFGNVPLVTEANELGTTAPAQATRQQLFDYVVKELNEIRPLLPAKGQYGRADQAAVNMLLAKLYLNSQVYTGTARFGEARAAAEAVIGSAYALDTNYRRMFSADNHTSPEIIFAVTQDGTRTQSYGGTTFLVHAAVGGDSLRAADFGINGGWWGLRSRSELVSLFAAGDRRASYFTTAGQQSAQVTELTNFQTGTLTPKYTNVTSTGQAGSDATFADTDYPMFRLADAYLMYAEAVLRGGGGSQGQALEYVNRLRRRANVGDITAAQLTLDFIRDERARELMWEGHRRTDLVRFDRFTTNGVWAFKGGVRAGRTTEAFRNLYPLPASELLANKNLKQNPGY